MTLSPLHAISPIDGRYHDKTVALRDIFSEFGLFKYRVLVEVRWLQALASHSDIAEVPALSNEANNHLNQIVEKFSEDDGLAIKQIEKTTNHDVKAVEYFIKDKIKDNDELHAISEFIHFACTSEDINNLAYATMVSTARQEVILPYGQKIIDAIKSLAHTYANQAMLARTHGQAATPTTVGKEMGNVAARLESAMAAILAVNIKGKINGAVGNFNAHRCAYPNVDWPTVSKDMVEGLGLSDNEYTTQIEPHDWLAELFHASMRFNSILIDFSRDIWGYISLGYFKQKLIDGEVGSSTMPHKVNPIDFENAEGNLGLANAIMQFLAQQLPTSRWQRDLVDSTLLRNCGVGFSHGLIAFQSILKGVGKLDISIERINADLEQNWAVLGEALQTVMRRYGIEKPYEKLKAFTRGKQIDKQSLHVFIDSLELPDAVKNDLKSLRPDNYLGYAVEMAKGV